MSALGQTELALKLPSGDSVTVDLQQAKIETSYPYRDGLIWGGDVGELPQSILISLHVQRGAETIYVPMSAYGDLGDVKSASLHASARGFVVSLHGGTTAAAYDVTLTFSAEYIVERLVALREFPKQRREKTTYSFPSRTGTN